jgi:hypothetical protein
LGALQEDVLRYFPAALLLLGFALAFLAWGIWFVSGAHGHGLASRDRTGIIFLAAASSVTLISAIALFVRRFVSGRRN